MHPSMCHYEQGVPHWPFVRGAVADLRQDLLIRMHHSFPRTTLPRRKALQGRVTALPGEHVKPRTLRSVLRHYVAQPSVTPARALADEAQPRDSLDGLPLQRNIHHDCHGLADERPDSRLLEDRTNALMSRTRQP